MYEIVKLYVENYSNSSYHFGTEVFTKFRCLHFPILYLCMKFCRLKDFLVIALQQSVDGQTDGQSDYYRAPTSLMTGP